MTKLAFILIFFTTTTFGQSRHDGLLGTYESIDNGFERYSIVALNQDNRFIYRSGLGGCQVEVTGTWTIENKKLKFTNDKEFLVNNTIRYPNLGLTTWTIKKLGIKPDKIVDSGCVKDDKLHLRK
jgi:hypothetical protein